MKLTYFIFFILLTQYTFGQTTMNLFIPDLSENKVDKLEVFDYSQIEMRTPEIKDSLVIKFPRNTVDCYIVRLTIGGRSFYKQVWLDPGVNAVKAHISKNNLLIDTVIAGKPGTPVHYKINQFNDGYTASLKKDTTATNAYLLKSFSEHIDNPFSITIGLYYLLLNINSKENLLKLHQLSASQKDKFKWYILHTSLYDRLDFLIKQNKLDWSKFKFFNIDNKLKDIETDKSDFQIVQFWFTKSKLSLQDHMSLLGLEPVFKSKSAQLISISIDQDYTNWKGYVEATKLNWPQYMEGKTNLITDFLFIDNFPTYMILDHKGNIIKTYFALKQVKEHFGIK